MQIETTEHLFQITINGQELDVDFSRMHPTVIAAHLKKAAQRFLNDKYSGESGQVKLDLVKADLHLFHSGAPMPERERKVPTTNRASVARNIARQFAITDLCAQLEKVLGGDEKTWAKHPASAKYYNVSEKGRVTPNMLEIDGYIERAKVREVEPRDFLAMAEKQLATAAEAVASADLSALGI